MSLENYYYKINIKPTCLSQVQEFLSSAVWNYVPYMTLSTNFQYSLGIQLSDQDPFLKSLKNKFDGTLRLYKFSRNSCYNWHKDAAIGCSLNLVMEDYHSFTLFDLDEKLSITNSIIEVKYEKNFWFLFNSQIKHMIINLDDRDRILLTMTFPRDVRYQDLLSYYKNY
jgi:hypothetical protein